MDPESPTAASLLDQRTIALATRPARGASQPLEPTQALIVWDVGESLFGTEVVAVAAVIPFAGCTPVPTREPACLGVIGRGGRFYSVIGMRRLLGLAAGDGPPRNLLLLRGAPPYLALAVDRVLGRFDVAFAGSVGGSAMALEGRLVAPFPAAELRARLGLSSPAARPPESNSQ